MFARLLCAGAAAALLLATASFAQAPSGRVFGGTRVTDATRWGSTVALVQHGMRPIDGHFCGGTLIEPDLVITAAHCMKGDLFWRLDGSGVDVLSGTLDLRSGGERVSVIGAYRHPAAKFEGLGSDIALLRLERPLVASVAPVGFSAAVAGQPAFIAGWGLLSESRLPADLEEATLHVRDEIECTSADIKDEYDARTMLCAGEHLAAGNVDTCAGDSGGPMLAESGELIGITSWGFGCAGDQSWGVYTRISSFTNWLGSTRTALQSGSLGAPTNLRAVAVSSGHVTLAWDAVAGARYSILGVESVKKLGRLDNGNLRPQRASVQRFAVPAGRRMVFSVRRVMPDGTQGDAAAPIAVTTPPDRIAPSPVRGLHVSRRGQNSVVISWRKPFDDVGVWRYEIQLREPGRWTDLGFTTKTRYRINGHASCVRILAVDAAGNRSRWRELCTSVLGR